MSRSITSAGEVGVEFGLKMSGETGVVLAAMKQKEVDERVELGDADVLSIIEKMMKQRRESVAQYASAARQDLVDAERLALRDRGSLLEAEAERREPQLGVAGEGEEGRQVGHGWPELDDLRDATSIRPGGCERRAVPGGGGRSHGRHSMSAPAVAVPDLRRCPAGA